MPIDRDRALGAELPALTTSWVEDDVILYHLGVGAGTPATDPGELEYCYEANLKVLPSFATTRPFELLVHLAGVDGLDFNLAMLLHGEQAVTLHGPLPTAATVTHRGKVAEIWDKGKGALVVLQVDSEDADGRPLFTNHYRVFLRGEGGFGGPQGPGPTVETPDRAPDLQVESPTLEQQALLYRLSGDKNPLHVDPAFAALGGFERPILHGLCSFGIVCKAAVDKMLGGDVAAVASYEGRFSGVVYPGETIVTSLWDEDDHIAIGAATKERQSPVMTNAAIGKRETT